MAEIKIADGGSLKRFRSWIKNTFYDKTTMDEKLDAIGSIEQATSSKAGIMKLFTALGQNTDGAPTNKAVQDAISAISLSMHPVGSYYLSENSTSPASLFGGTWEQMKDRVLIGAGNSYGVGATGGESTHTLTTSEMPSHSHTRGTMNITGAITGMRLGTTRSDDGSDFSHSGALYGSPKTLGGSFREADYAGEWKPLQINLDASRNWTGKTSTAGSSASFNIMNPYRAVYMWRRTA